MKNNLQKLNTLYIAQKLDAFILKTKKEIEEIREKWDIPIENGLANDEKFLQWQKQNLDINNYPKKFKSPLQDIVLEKRILIGDNSQLLGRYRISKALLWEIENFLFKHKLANFYLKPIVCFILFNNFDNQELTNGTLMINLPKITQQNKNFFKNIPLAVYPDTTIKDIQMIWPEVEKLKKMLFGVGEDDRKKVAKNYERDKRIYELYRVLGKDYKSIAEIILRDLGVHLYRTEIPPIIQRFIKRHNLNT